MTAYNFRPRFAALVKDGRKRQTIRKFRLRGNPVPGSILQLYQGLRTKACQRLLSDVKCTEVRKIWIEYGRVILDNHELDQRQRTQLAHADGFKDIIDFYVFFRDQYGLPFEGILIKW